MNDWSPLLHRYWFVAALSSAVRAAPQRVMLFGKPAVLARNSAGKVLAFEDRCPHRGAALSAGRLTPRGLMCPYHGWTFGADGNCTSMPGTQGAKPLGEFRVPAFEAVERDGLVWVAAATGLSLPERVLAMRPEQARFVQQFCWGAPVLDAQENFLDALHTHTVHPGLVRGSAERKPVEVTLRVGGDGFAVDYRGQATQSGMLFKLFESPRISERAYFSALSVAQIEYQYADGSAIWISLYFTPQTDTSTHVFATLHVSGRWAPRWLVRLLVWPLLRQVANQDQKVIEQQQHLREFFPGRRAAVTPLDIARPYLESAWLGREQQLPAEVNRTFYL